MGIKDEFNKAVDNTKDTVKEGLHRGEADTEREKRRVDGDDMTFGDKAKSVVNEGKNDVQADYDKTKKDVRNS
ncbi:MAG: hypothetical protein GIW98_04760 [Candidatus Eremiobacteraeota bacterium]|nr:hypothetical protein [Candidatus Eremiobacteraeota bacterium]